VAAKIRKEGGSKQTLLGNTALPSKLKAQGKSDELQKRWRDGDAGTSSKGTTETYRFNSARREKGNHANGRENRGTEFLIDLGGIRGGAKDTYRACGKTHPTPL